MIAFLDSDDEWLPGFLQASVTRLQRCSPQVGVAFSSFLHLRGGHINASPSWLRRALSYLPFKRFRLQGDLYQALLRGNFITLQAAVLRRDCLEKTGLFDEDLPRLQDWEFWLRLARHYRFTWVAQPLVRLLPGSDRISSNPQALPAAVQHILEKHGGANTAELDAHCHFILGDYHLWQGQLQLGRAHFWQAVHLSPTTLLYWIAAVSALLHPVLYQKFSVLTGSGYHSA